MEAILAAVIGSFLTPVLAVELHIAKKVHDHDLADQHLALAVEQIDGRVVSVELTAPNIAKQSAKIKELWFLF